MPLKRKIEDRSITALQLIIDAHPTMDASINKRDKELSWDGYIRLFINDDATSDKLNYDDDVPIQIKGHVDKDRKHMDKERITASIDLDDLNVYYRNFGCLYFVMYMTEDGSEVEIFYSSLYPSKIKGILEEAERRHNTSSISIPFLKLAKDCKELYLLCKQFSFEIRKQGSGYGQIVPRSITGDGLQMVKQITATTVGGKTPYDLLKRINTGDAVIYATIDDSGIQYPMQIYGIVASVKNVIEMPILIGEKQYYSSIETEDTVTAPDAKNYVKDGTVTVRPSPNVTFTFKGTDINFKFRFITDLMQLKHDAEFMLDLLDKKEMTIFGATSKMGNAKIDNGFLHQLRSIIEAGQVLEDIGCNILIPFKELTEEDKRQIDLLCNIRDGHVHFNTEKEKFLYTWVFRGKSWPLVVDISGDEVNLLGYVFNTDLVFSIGTPDGKDHTNETLPDDAYIVPNFVRFEPELLANIYWYNYESMFEQIDRSVVVEATADELNGLALNLIAAYDLSGNEKLLDVADEVLIRLIDVFPNIVHYVVNACQIEVRKNGALSDASRECLDEMAGTVFEAPPEGQADVGRVFAYCRAVLKGETELADELYSKLTDADRTSVDGFPIRTLHQKLR